MNKPPEQMTMGGRIRMVREEQGLDQVELAMMSGIERTTLSSIENNHRAGLVFTIAQIAKSLNVSLDFLVGISNNR